MTSEESEPSTHDIPPDTTLSPAHAYDLQGGEAPPQLPRNGEN